MADRLAGQVIMYGRLRMNTGDIAKAVLEKTAGNEERGWKNNITNYDAIAGARGKSRVLVENVNCVVEKRVVKKQSLMGTIIIMDAAACGGGYMGLS